MDIRSARAPLSIGLVSPAWPLELYPNGVITYVAGVAEGMRALGHQTTILAHRVKPADRGNAVYEIETNGTSRSPVRRVLDGLGHRIAPRWAGHRAYRRRLVAAVRRASAERGLQILEMEESFGAAGWLQPLVSIPVCVRLHGPWFLNGAALGVADDPEFRRRLAQEGRALARASAVTSPSADVLNQTRAYYDLPLDHAVVIPNPIRTAPPAERWQLEACDRRQILFVGRFDRHKGGDLIVEAFAHILREMPDAQLSFAGPDRGLVDDAGGRWNIDEFVDNRLPGARASGRLRLLGEIPNSNLGVLRRSAMVTVVCSRYENFPYAVIEAMAMGCPLVASRVGGIPEIVRHDVDGLLHRGGDSSDLAAQIMALLTAPTRAAQLGRNAAIRCEQAYHPAVVAAQTIDYYHRVVHVST